MSNETVKIVFKKPSEIPERYCVVGTIVTLNTGNTYKREKSKWVKLCPHGSQISRCKECKGSLFCEHGCRKYRCTACGKSEKKCPHGKCKSRCAECDGSGICSHNKVRSNCRDCGGSSFCKHNKYKQYCKDCGGVSICPHNRVKATCIDCDGSGVCKHNRLRMQCITCKGTNICDHDKRKINCSICSPHNFCEHEILHANCTKCKGKNVCVHGVMKSKCTQGCGGGSYCHHNILRSKCFECGGIATCKSHPKTKCYNQVGGNKTKYEGHCSRCYAFLFPDKAVSKNYRIKERAVVDYIKHHFPDFTMIANKQVPDGCSGRRPDIMFNFGSHIVVIEVDENQHLTYECEQRRMLEIMQDAGTVPSVFIRFNPDSYKQEDGTQVKSCWSLTSTGRATIHTKCKKQWADRLSTLKQTLEKYIEATPKEFTVEYLYFDYGFTTRTA